MKLALLAVALVASSASAEVKKPSANAAKGAAVGWAKALVAMDATNPKAAELAAVIKLTSAPFRLFVFDDGSAKCDSTTSERDKLGDAIACVRGTSAAILPLKPYSPAVLKELWGDLKARKAEIEKLAKTHVLLVHNETGEDVTELAIVAITADADGTPRVAAVFTGYQTR